MAGNQLSNCVRASKKLSRFSSWIAAGAAVIAVPLGFIGFNSDCDPTSKGGWAALLQTYQLFVLNVDVESLCHGFTWWAAFIAPIATFSALIAVFSHAVSTWWRRVCLRNKEPDVVFLAGGKNATSIALQKYPKDSSHVGRDKESVVFVDSSATPLVHEHISNLGCKVCDWHGDALSGDVLQSTNTVKARQVWVLTGDDRRNIEIAQTVVSASQKAGNQNQLVMANVDNQELIRDVSFAIGDHASIRFFSIKKLASRYLLRNYGPKLPLHKEGSITEISNQLHIAIVGSGDMVEALVEQAIVHFVYSEKPADCIRITLIGKNANVRMAELKLRLPTESEYSSDHRMMKLLPIVQLNAIDCVPSRIKHSDWTESQADLPFDAVYVNDNVDLNTIAWTIRAAALRELEGQSKNQMIVACVSQASYDDAALEGDAADTLPENVQLVRMYDCIGTTDSYPGESQDSEAMLINLAYDVYDVDLFNNMDVDAALERAKEKWNGSTMDNSLAEIFRRSSRFAADHILIKLAILYPELSGKEPTALYDYARDQKSYGPWASGPEQSPNKIINDLMKLEHRRFVVERLVDGWLPTEELASGDDAKIRKLTALNKKLRLNETLVPFDVLPEHQKEKDRLIVECIPKILELKGK